MKNIEKYPGLLLILVSLMFPSLWASGNDGMPSDDGAPPDDQPVVGSTAKAEASRYAGQNKRDPFMSLLKIREEDRTKAVPPPPLKERPPGLSGLLISEVAVAGIAAGNSKNIIVLKGIDGISYIAEPGSKLFDGVLKTVDSKGITFMRTEKSTDGKTKTYKVTKPFNSSEKQVLP